MLGGFPFFYWYQLMWVVIVAILAAVAYLLSKLAQRGNAASARIPGQGTGGGGADISGPGRATRGAPAGPGQRPAGPPPAAPPPRAGG